MNKKNKALLIFITIVIVTSLCESLYPIGPFICVGCFTAYLLGRWEVNNGI